MKTLIGDVRNDVGKAAGRACEDVVFNTHVVGVRYSVGERLFLRGYDLCHQLLKMACIKAAGYLRKTILAFARQNL